VSTVSVLLLAFVDNRTPLSVTLPVRLLCCNALSEAGVATAAFWDSERIELPQSANLTVTCSVEGVDRYDVIRVVHSYGAKTLLLADNDVTGPIFASLPRYNVTYQYGDNTARVTVHITGKDGR